MEKNNIHVIPFPGVLIFKANDLGTTFFTYQQSSSV